MNIKDYEIVKEHLDKLGEEMLPSVSIIITTYNRANNLGKCIDSLLKIDYPEYEIVLVNDGSTDNTGEILKEYEEKYNIIKIVNREKNKGWAASKNSGILASEHDLIVLIDDDIIVDRGWLAILVTELMKNIKNKVAGVTSVDIHAGHSICYLKDVMIRAGLFDERFTLNLRQDTDLSFNIIDLGFKIIYTPRAKFTHDHPPPNTILQKIKYIKNRLWVHQNDVLLFKNHPERTKEFLDIRFGFLRNPIKDFQIATGTWSEGGNFKLSSPQGVTIIENKTPFHTLVIFLGGLTYVLAVKLVRLCGSIKYRKLLI